MHRFALHCIRDTSSTRSYSASTLRHLIRRT